MRWMTALCASTAMWGCHTYQVRDSRTGTIYYAEGWVAADGYRGPLSFRDHSGRSIDLRDASVMRISHDEFDEAVGVEKPTATTTAPQEKQP